MSNPTPLAGAFETALRHHQAGRLDEAESIYRQILTAQPGDPQALYLLGRVEHQRGRFPQAAALAALAIEADPLEATYHQSLGDTLLSQGRPDAAADALREALRLNPEDAPTQFSLALALVALGDPAAAEACYREAVRLKGDFFEALNNLGALLDERRQYAEARKYLAEAVRVRPGSSLARNNLARAFRCEALYDEAIEVYRQALELDPRDVQAHFYLGLCLLRTGRYAEAMAEMQQVAEIEPGRAEAYANAGFLNLRMGNLEGAVAASRRAVELDRNLGEAHLNLGLACLTLGRLDEAIDSFRAALQINEGDVRAHDNLLCTLNAHPGYSAEQVFTEYQAWTKRHADPLAAPAAPHDNDRTPTRRLRLGYVSEHFRAHPAAAFIEPILAAHDSAGFELFCYASGPSHLQDETTARLRGHADQWRDIARLDDQQAAAIVRGDRIDLLVDLDGHLGGNRLLVFARKPAPVQASYLGSRGTTAMTAIQYRLTDAYSDPPGTSERFYAEQLVRLPRSSFCYRPPDDAPAVGPLPALSAGSVTFGSFNAFFKVTPAALETWARLLAAVPGSRLILLAPESEELLARVRDVFQRHEVEGGRLEIVPPRPHREYLELIARADVALDAFPAGGHATTCETLWMGVPVVTLAGNNCASRIAGCALTNLNLQDFIAQSPEQYLEIAVRACSDLDQLARLRAELRPRMSQSALLDAPGVTRRLEAAYREMWRRYCARPPGA
jgi:protein O-GlcNAc transferase